MSELSRYLDDPAPQAEVVSSTTKHRGSESSTNMTALITVTLSGNRTWRWVSTLQTLVGLSQHSTENALCIPHSLRNAEFTALGSGKFCSQLHLLLISSCPNNPQILLMLTCLGTKIYSFSADASRSLCRKCQCLAGDKVIAARGGRWTRRISRHNCFGSTCHIFTDGHSSAAKSRNRDQPWWVLHYGSDSNKVWERVSKKRGKVKNWTGQRWSLGSQDSFAKALDSFLGWWWQESVTVETSQ